MRSSRAIALTAVLACASVSHAQQWGKDAKDDASGGGSIVLLDAPKGWERAYAAAISADGSTIVGMVSNDDDEDGWYESRQPLRWDPSGDFERLEVDEDSASITATVVTATGDMILGFEEEGERVVYWLAGKPARPLESDGKPVTWASSISADGSILLGSHDEQRVDMNGAFRIEYTPSSARVVESIDCVDAWELGCARDGYIMGMGIADDRSARAMRWNLDGRPIVLLPFTEPIHATGAGKPDEFRYAAMRSTPDREDSDTIVWSDIVIYEEYGELSVIHAGASSRNEYDLLGASDDLELLFGDVWIYTEDGNIEDIAGWIWTPELGLVSCDDAFDAWGIDREGYSIARVSGVSADGKSLVGECAEEGSSLEDDTRPFFVKLD